MKKILIFSDQHLSCKQYGNKKREQDFIDSFEYCVTQAIEKKCDAMILPGDVLDVKNPSSETMYFLKNQNKRLTDSKIKAFYITGNHENCNPNWLELFDDSRYGFTSINNQTYTLFKNDGGKDIVDVSIEGIQEMPKNELIEKFNELTDKTILVIHASVKEFIGIDINNPLSIKDLPTNKFKLICVGDTHVPKLEKIDNCMVLSPGSTELKSSSEPTEKYYWIVECDEGKITEPEPHPIPTRNVIQLNIDTETDIKNAITQLQTQHKETKRLIFCKFNSELNVLNKIKAVLDDDDILRYTYYDKNIINKQNKNHTSSDFDISLNQIVKDYELEDKDENLVLNLIEPEAKVEDEIDKYLEMLKNSD